MSHGSFFLPNSVSDISITALKFTLGLHRDQEEEICIYLSSNSAKAAGLAKSVRAMKRDMQWKIVFLDPGNPLLHPSRMMSPDPLTASRPFCTVIPP